MKVYSVFPNQSMGSHMRELLSFWIILTFFSSKTSGLACSSTLTNCCSDVNQSCFQVLPYSSSMLGGRALRILGLTLPPDGRLLCRFKGEIEQQGIIDEEGHPYCIAPLLYETGWISFDVSTDGTDFNRSGEYLSVHPSKADPTFEVTLVNSTLWQNYGTPNMAGQLRMTWNSSLIKSERVNVELWGYREVSRSPAGSSSLQAEISYLYSVGRNISNTGDFSFIPQPRERFSTWELGNIRITASPKSEGERYPQHISSF